MRLPAVTRRLTKGIPEMPLWPQIKDHRVTRKQEQLIPSPSIEYVLAFVYKIRFSVKVPKKNKYLERLG